MEHHTDHHTVQLLKCKIASQLFSTKDSIDRQLEVITQLQQEMYVQESKLMELMRYKNSLEKIVASENK